MTRDMMTMMMILDKTIKEANLMLQQFRTVTNFTTCHEEAPEIIRLERRAKKNVATENCLYNTISTIRGRYYHKQITQKFKTA
jgi:MoaA/NifB/PqqE/SkfB family radical SAM enzyme